MNTKTLPKTGGGSIGAESRQPLPEPPGGWPRDNYAGFYGKFKRDPYTGIREPADEETRRAMEALGITSAHGQVGAPADAAATPAPTTTPAADAGAPAA